MPIGVWFDLNFTESSLLPIKLEASYKEIPELKLELKNFFCFEMKQASCIRYENHASQILSELKSEEYDSMWESFLLG